MASINICIADYLDEAKTEDLIYELNRRRQFGKIAFKSRKEKLNYLKGLFDLRSMSPLINYAWELGKKWKGE
ncbi:MAG: hypothetical protein LBR10_14510 [Prevotellaceae bacterium]|jgi:hypothetical protein|nr:hypothetical protein [Prevotellaceae bacterium]